MVLISFLAAFGATGGLLAAGLLPQDHPKPRSSHTLPTPRGGGIAIVLGFALASLGLGAMGFVPKQALIAVLGGGLAVAAVGLLDDLGHVPILIRLSAHVGAAIWGLAWATQGFELYLVVAGLVLVWLVNLYNFMDGIDGLAAVEALTVAISAAWILAGVGYAGFSFWLLGLAAAAGGFLCWNWPPARVFMGDVGSGFLGFALGMLAWVTSQVQAITLWSWAILLAVFVTDATLTLLWRMATGQKFWQAHRSHAYQHLAARCGHLKVSSAAAAINVFWLLPLAWAAARFPQAGGALTGLAYAPLVWLAHWARAGRT
ncbi:MAG: glycosyltransferase family 4 protein [Methylohalobius sp.]|nr:glycosyltransferase family 4 protein [Methylohalobius sp.]